MLPSSPEIRTTVKSFATLPAMLLPVLLLVPHAAPAADHGTIVREAIIYLSPDSASHKLAQAERGREVILLDKSRNWVSVESLLGYANNPDPYFIEDEDVDQQTVNGR